MTVQVTSFFLGGSAQSFIHKRTVTLCNHVRALFQAVVLLTIMSLLNKLEQGQGFRRNQYEENLFRCEDDRYELDMMIETNDSCIRSMNRLNEKVKELALD